VRREEHSHCLSRCARGVSLLTDLDAFYLDHRRCGDLDPYVDGPVVWFVYECGARIVRRVAQEETPPCSP
jgi:hypothetical protein